MLFVVFPAQGQDARVPPPVAQQGYRQPQAAPVNNQQQQAYQQQGYQPKQAYQPQQQRQQPNAQAQGAGEGYPQAKQQLTREQMKARADEADMLIHHLRGETIRQEIAASRIALVFFSAPWYVI
jgi:hypothetical protein